MPKVCISSTARATPLQLMPRSWDNDGAGIVTKWYQFKPPCVGFAPEIFPEVEVFHQVEDESKWMFPGGINPDEWYHVVVREVSVHQHFMENPLPVDCQ